jgi:hypothetical protein
MPEDQPKYEMSLELEQELPHEQYDKMVVKCDPQTVEIYLSGWEERVMMTHAEFDAVILEVNRYRKCAEAGNVEIS